MSNTWLKSFEDYERFIVDNTLSCIMFAKDDDDNLKKCNGKCSTLSNQYPEVSYAFAFIENIVSEPLDKNLYCVYEEGEKVFEANSSNKLITFIDPVVELDVSKHDLDELLEDNSLCFMDYTATWCKPCKRIAPVYRALARRYTDALFLKIDVDQHPDLVKEKKIRSMPTFVCMKDGEMVDTCSGCDETKLCKLVTSNL